jgi:hypothetical protein
MMEETMFPRSVFAVLIAAGVCRADGLSIDGPTTVEPYRIVRLEAKGVPEKAGVIWNITPKVNGSAPDWATSKHSRKALWTGKPGTYTVQLIAVAVAEDRSVTLDSTEKELRIGADPDPTPPLENLRSGKLDEPSVFWICVVKSPCVSLPLTHPLVEIAHLMAFFICENREISGTRNAIVLELFF